MPSEATRLAALGALAVSRRPVPRGELEAILASGGVSPEESRAEVLELERRGALQVRGGGIELTADGVGELLSLHAQLTLALDDAATRPGQEECPSLPWLTLVETRWIDALSLNFAVDPHALQAILPAPLEPEVWKGSAWVQLLVSSLRDMRPQGLSSLFGVCFYQASYRAAVRYRSADGSLRRGGYFVRSDTNHPVMRAVGNALAEFKFHHFGLAEMVMVRDGDRLTLGIDPHPDSEGGRVVGLFDTRPSERPPRGSVWGSLDELEQPLVECYDALGVDADGGFLYVLTIDRDPWRARFVRPEEVYVEWMERGPLQPARLDSVLHFRECGYRWRPLRREKIG